MAAAKHHLESSHLLVERRLISIMDAANSLLRDNFTINQLDVRSLCVKPAIWIAVEARLAGLVARDEAYYCAQGHDDIGPYRIGQFERCGCRICWKERGH
jgi:hypothetical protein